MTARTTAPLDLEQFEGCRPATCLPYLYRENGMLILAPNTELPRTRIVAEVTRGHATIDPVVAMQDGEYLVAAANAFPALLAECKRARADVAALKVVIVDTVQAWDSNPNGKIGSGLIEHLRAALARVGS